MKSSKKAAPKKSAAAQAKSEKKGGKSAKAAATPPPAEEAAVDPDELEEQEDMAAAAASGASGGLAPVTPTETSVSFKNFRHHPDMENFYRFIYENDLRYEALDIIDQVLTEKHERKKLKAEKSKAH